MKKLLLPAAFVALGVGTGVGAGLFLRPAATAGDAGAEHATGSDGGAGENQLAAPASHAAAKEGRGYASDGRASGDGHGGGGEYVKLGNQFIVPILDKSRVNSLVVLTIDLEVGPAGAATVHRVEPKIRDAFLTVLFDHANAGGFTGTFTSSGSMEALRRSLREAGRKAVGEGVVKNVLITGIMRQDV